MRIAKMLAALVITASLAAPASAVASEWDEPPPGWTLDDWHAWMIHKPSTDIATYNSRYLVMSEDDELCRLFLKKNEKEARKKIRFPEWMPLTNVLFWKTKRPTPLWATSFHLVGVGDMTITSARYDQGQGLYLTRVALEEFLHTILLSSELYNNKYDSMDANSKMIGKAGQKRDFFDKADGIKYYKTFFMSGIWTPFTYNNSIFFIGKFPTKEQKYISGILIDYSREGQKTDICYYVDVKQGGAK